MPTVKYGERTMCLIWDVAITMGFGFEAPFHTNCNNRRYFLGRGIRYDEREEIPITDKRGVPL